jgi:integrase/recombinase XerD
MELVQAGVDCSVIALWLGHESIETTQTYLHAHLALKEAALAKLKPYEHGKRTRFRRVRTCPAAPHVKAC